MTTFTWPMLKTYDQDHLARIALPLGGIGTGTVSLGGGERGRSDWCRAVLKSDGNRAIGTTIGWRTIPGSCGGLRRRGKACGELDNSSISLYSTTVQLVILEVR